MMADTLDTLATARRLKRLRFDDEQAEGLAELLRERELAQRGELATKADLLALRHDVEAQIGSLRHDLEAQIGSLRHVVEAQGVAMQNGFASVDQRMAMLEQRMTIKLGVMLAGSVAIVGAMLKLL